MLKYHTSTSSPFLNMNVNKGLLARDCQWVPHVIPLKGMQPLKHGNRFLIKPTRGSIILIYNLPRECCGVGGWTEQVPALHVFFSRRFGLFQSSFMIKYINPRGISNTRFSLVLGGWAFFGLCVGFCVSCYGVLFDGTYHSIREKHSVV